MRQILQRAQSCPGAPSFSLTVNTAGRMLPAPTCQQGRTKMVVLKYTKAFCSVFLKLLQSLSSFSFLRKFMYLFESETGKKRDKRQRKMS